MDRKLRTFIMTAAAIINFSALYYSVILLPSENGETTEQQVQAEGTGLNEQGEALATCLEKTYRAHSHEWNRYCRVLGRKPDCALPRFIAVRLDTGYEDNRRGCLKVYRAEYIDMSILHHQ